MEGPLTLRAQLAALVAAVLAPRLLGRRSAGWPLVFFVAGGAVAAGIAYTLFAGRDALGDAVLTFLLPEHLVGAARALVCGAWSHEMEGVLTNATISGSLLALSMILIPVRERISMALETERALTDEPMHEERLFVLLVEIAETTIVFFTVHLGVGHHALRSRRARRRAAGLREDRGAVTVRPRAR